jgi:FkbM family methyltransferase
VDIGAYRGDIPRLFLQEAVHGHVIGFEPNPNNYRYLKRRFPTSQIEQVALDNRSGLKTFLRGRDRPARSRLAAMGSKGQMAGGTNEQLEVLVTTLDDYFGNDDRVDFIKIDAEGAELEILQGGIKVLSANQPFMVIEHGLSPSQSAVTKSFELFQLVREEIHLKLFSLDRLVTKISNSADFIDSLRAANDYFFTAPQE